jgi:hypothetical protein
MIEAWGLPGPRTLAAHVNSPTVEVVLVIGA